jgi:hypothetical protein
MRVRVSEVLGRHDAIIESDSRDDVNGRILEIERDRESVEVVRKLAGELQEFSLKTGSIPQVEIESGTSLHPWGPRLEKAPRRVRRVAAVPS